jgi:putative ABC transport system permease protein
MWRTTIASLRGHKRRVLATCSAVLLGVTFLSGTLVLGDTMRAGFGGMFEEANAETDALARSTSTISSEGFSASGTIEASLADQLAAVDGVDAAAPLVEGSGQIVGSDGDALGGDGPPTEARNWIEDERLNPYRLDDGRSAEQGDLAIGDTTVVRVPEPVDVTVVGVATFGSQDSMGGTTMAAFTTEEAQALLLPEAGSLTGVVLGAADGVGQDELVERITPLLPDGAEAITGEALTTEQEKEVESDFVSFFETFLLVFAGIALVVATFSIYNTFSIVVAQRTRESALQRAFGASRKQVLASVVVEAVAIGLLASAVGVAAGIALSRGLSSLFDAFDFDLPTSELVVEPGSIVISMAVGLIATVLAGIAPAVKASRVPPMAALRAAAVDRASSSRIRVAAGLLVGGIGVGLTVAGATGGSLPLTGGGALAVVLGVVLFGPVVARPAAAVLGTPTAGVRGASGKLARANAMRNPTRTAGTASALMVGVAVVGMFTVVAASLKAYINDSVEGSLTGDLVLLDDSFSSVGNSPEMTAEIASLPAVETAAGLAAAPVQLDGDDTVVDVADGPQLARVLDMQMDEGSLDDLVGETVALRDTYADDNGLTVGDRLPMGFADGAERDLTVAAVYGSGEFAGDVMLSSEVWSRHAVQETSDIVFIGLADGVGLDEGRTVIQPIVDRYGGTDLRDGEEVVADVSSEIDQILTIVYVLLALAIIIALMSIGNTLSLSIHERTRELGLLRAVGQSRRQLRTMVRGEALTVALFGTAGGIGLGCFLGWALMKTVTTVDNIPWAFDLPVGQLMFVFVLGGMVGLVAAMRPARRAAKLDILTAIAAD